METATPEYPMNQNIYYHFDFHSGIDVYGPNCWVSVFVLHDDHWFSGVIELRGKHLGTHIRSSVKFLPHTITWIHTDDVPCVRPLYRRLTDIITLLRFLAEYYLTVDKFKDALNEFITAPYIYEHIKFCTPEVTL